MKKIIFCSILLVLLVAGALAGGGWWYAHRPLAMKQAVAGFVVPKGAGMRQAANAIAAAGVEVHPRLLAWLARFSGRAREIKAGSYEVRAGITPWQLILKLGAGEVSRGEILLLEGWTFRQVRAAVEKHPDLQADTVNLSEAEILARVGAREKHAEGLFFPDTYVFDKHSGALALLARAHRAMQTRLIGEWEGRASGLPLKSPYEALILASIVEKETGRSEERARIAAVFLNRLRAGMRLQTDPTVIYGLGENFDGNLRRRDLEADTPWNTYTRAGLPPTPIAMPGQESLRAVLHPEDSREFYFVSRGDGSSAFSRTLEEHNQAVARYQRRRAVVNN
ncbi:MAG: endolytic transglycosylase MltG [Azoarcus sp.]|nr:endolytic transglycosylase MltG [Azoarcus sp.]